MTRLMSVLLISLMAGCAVGVATPEDTDARDAEDMAALGSTQQELRIGTGGGGGGGLGLACSECSTNYDDCLVDAGGDPELIGWCNWERRVCNRHCDGWIIAIQR